MKKFNLRRIRFALLKYTVLAHQISISDILSWFRNFSSYPCNLNQAVTRCLFIVFFFLIQAHGQVTSVFSQKEVIMRYASKGIQGLLEAYLRNRSAPTVNC